MAGKIEATSGVMMVPEKSITTDEQLQCTNNWINKIRPFRLISRDDDKQAQNVKANVKKQMTVTKLRLELPKID
uniref:Uncharacterized protein n=1 Tax=Strigamia maritima TaxID=126957 RepID=T1IR63_STRMM